MRHRYKLELGTVGKIVKRVMNCMIGLLILLVLTSGYCSASPQAPLLAVEIVNDRVLLSWTSVEESDGYRLFYAPFPSAHYIEDVDMGTLTEVSYELWPGAAFYVAIKAYNGSGESEFSNIEIFAFESGQSEVPNAEITLSVTAHPENTLMAIARVDMNTTGSVSVEFSPDPEDSGETRQTAATNSGQEHEIVVVGMRANTTYRMKAIGTLGDGSTVESESVAFSTGPLPDTAPDVAVASIGGKSMGGITLFGAAAGGPGSESSGSDPVYYGVDEAGEIVWYLHGGESAQVTPSIRRVEPGVLMVFLSSSVRTITPAGETITDYDLSAIRKYHHDAILLPNGNIMVLGSDSGTFDGETLAGDRIYEIDPNGNVVWEWSAFDHLDTTRFPGALSSTTTAAGNSLDWSHCNALFYIEEDQAILLSSRSQSWVIKIDHNTGEIVWVFGDDAGTADDFEAPFFTLNDGTWMSNQHAPMLTSNGELLLYDNRNESDGKTQNSRAVKYALDASTMTATQSWEAIAPIYTMSFGDVDELPNGNVLMCAGSLGGKNMNSGSSSQAHIIEVATDADATVQWDLTLDTSVYRAERVSWDDFL